MSNATQPVTGRADYNIDADVDISPNFLAVLQSGWTFVGHLRTNTDGSIMTHAGGRMASMVNVCAVRRWGTEYGLGQLALQGPLPNTLLDPMGTIEFPMASLFFFLRINKARWDDYAKRTTWTSEHVA